MFQEGRLAKMMTTTKLVLYDLISVRKGQKLLNKTKSHLQVVFLYKRLWNCVCWGMQLSSSTNMAQAQMKH